MDVMQNKGTVMEFLKWFLFIISVLGFGVFLAPVFTGIFNIGNAAGMIFFGALALLCLKHKAFFAFLHEHTAARVIVSIIAAVLAVLFIGAVIISVLMINAASDAPKNADTVIVLGCRVKGDRPSLMLEKRINAAYEYLCENENATAILSGGQGSDEMISEAECMYSELVKKGVSEDRLITEDKSVNTRENIRNSFAIIDSKGLSGNIAIVTNEFHQYRAKLIAKKEGRDVTAVTAKTAFYLLPTYWVRDCLGCAYEIIFS
jgi:uncharacterized SAM-binding protein YcdF (DUF218 family)